VLWLEVEALELDGAAVDELVWETLTLLDLWVLLLLSDAVGYGFGAGAVPEGAE
jgi:hypothetical protein